MNKTYCKFYIDLEVADYVSTQFIEETLDKYNFPFSTDLSHFDEKFTNVIFTKPKKIKKFSNLKNKIFICPDTQELEIQNGIYVDYLSFNDLSESIQIILEAEKKSLFHSKIRESEKILENVKNSNHIRSTHEIIGLHKCYEEILDLEIELLKSEKISDWNIEFKKVIGKSNWIQSLQILTLEQVLDLELYMQESNLLLKLPFEDYLIELKINNLMNDEHYIKLELLISMILRSLQIFDQKLVRNDVEIDFWKRIFAKIPYPMSVITPLGDLLIYNELFAKIGILPKVCLSYKDQESVEINQQFYIVKKIEFEISTSKVFYFIFYTTEKLSIVQNEKKTGIDDLGIVSSSIAHELNNPLAGILAALSLLLLEEHWDNDSLDEIYDMQKGARRCKELVEIFLGFSRISPTHKFQASVKDSLDQAINLLRFRMVESNLRIDMRFQSTLESFAGIINPSILSMILYLILNELLTSFAHHRLISQVSANHLSGEFLEFSNQLIFKLDDDFEYEEKLVHSKLIHHLLIFEKMEINFQNKEIRLIHRA